MKPYPNRITGINRKYQLLLAIGLLLNISFLQAKAQTLVSYEKPISIEIGSTIFKEDRKINIYLPQNYKRTKIDYPVLYVLDGQRKELENFVIATVDYQLKYNTIPAFIIVVIPQINRAYEFNPVIAGQNIPTIGGADNFLSYLAAVDTYLKKNYRIAPFNMIFGHSLGASLATYALIKRPELFHAYLLASPNYTFNNGYYLKQVDSIVKVNPAMVKSKFIYLALGDQWEVEQNFRSATLKADSILRQSKSEKYYFSDNKGYGHNTTPIIALVGGLDKIFASYWQDRQNLGNSIWNKKGDPGELLQNQYNRLSNWYGYPIKASLADYQYYTGKAYLDDKDFKKAARYVKEGLEMYPNDTDLLVAYADALSGLKQNINAKVYYQLALKTTTDLTLIESINKKIADL